MNQTHTHTQTHTRSLSRPHSQPRDIETLGALVLRPKTSPAQSQTVFISIATFENRERSPHFPTGAAPPATGGHHCPSQEAADAEGGVAGWLWWAVPGARSGRAWAGRAGQCIRPGSRARPGGERTGMGRAFRPGTGGDGGSGRTPKRPGGTREGPGNPLGRRRP